MDPQQIKTLIDAMAAASDLTEMEYSQDGWTLRLVRQAPALSAAESQRTPLAGAAPAVAVRPASSPASPEPARASELHAPLYGVVHLAPSPDEPPFVVAGQAVKAGQTLCIVEAMKVFNEVRADHDATVQAVLVASGQEVEAGQALLRFA
jgi:acetyl-CoA carboxylase biotin carboxyl carrier protein